MYNYLVEFLGTLLFIYIILATENPIAIAAAWCVIILLIRDVSGGYINPAVSIVMASAGKLPIDELIPYCVSQILGGLAALEIYKRYKL